VPAAGWRGGLGEVCRTIRSGAASVYGANGAMEAPTRALAVELAEPRVRVNAVRPGVVRTEMWDGMPPAERELFGGRAALVLPRHGRARHHCGHRPGGRHRRDRAARPREPPGFPN